MECQHESGKGGRCEICGIIVRHRWTEERNLSSAREDGDAEGVTIKESEHGDSQPRKERLAASVAVQANGKPEALTKSDLHQTEKERSATKSRKRRRRKAN